MNLSGVPSKEKIEPAEDSKKEKSSTKTAFQVLAYTWFIFWLGSGAVWWVAALHFTLVFSAMNLLFEFLPEKKSKENKL